MKSILEFGANPNGTGDVCDAFDAAFAAGCFEIEVPAGEYQLVRSLQLPSNTKIHLSKDARVFAAPGKDARRRVHMVGNVDPIGGNENIEIVGGFWDGFCEENLRTSYLDNEFVGLMFDFVNVNGLKLSELIVKNASCYHFRLGEVKNFEISKVHFADTLSPLCQDGFHIGAFCENGVLRDITAVEGALGDDLIALNADDVFTYAHNEGMKQGPIKHITIENVYAPNVYTGVRFLTITEEISDIRLKNLKIGFRIHGLNFDAARYCEDPIFTDDQYPDGVGNIRDVVFEDLTLWKCNEGREVFTFESNCADFTIRNFRRARELEPANVAPTMIMQHLCDTDLTVNGEKKFLAKGEQWIWDCDSFDELIVNRRTEI